MYKYKLTLAYDGTNYSGWQIQPNATSIQTLVEQALTTILRRKTHVTGSGRTDSGVHALGQVAHFSALEDLDLEKILASLNGLLPLDIRVLSLEKAPEDFHARFSATGKIYRYHFHITPNPFKKLYSYYVPYPIDLVLLEKCLSYFVGRKDFTSFSNEAHRGSASKNPYRTIRKLELFKEEDGFFLEFEADGFLYKMVRNIMGTLFDVSRGKIPLDTLPEIFAAKDRRKAGRAALAHGLFLVEVLYNIIQPPASLEATDISACASSERD